MLETQQSILPETEIIRKRQQHGWRYRVHATDPTSRVRLTAGTDRV